MGLVESEVVYFVIFKESFYFSLGLRDVILVFVKNCWSLMCKINYRGMWSDFI